MINYFLQQSLGLEVFAELFNLLIEIIFLTWLTTFFEVLLFDVLLGIFDNIFVSGRWGFDNPLSFGFFLILLATASGVLWYNAN